MWNYCAGTGWCPGAAPCPGRLSVQAWGCGTRRGAPGGVWQDGLELKGDGGGGMPAQSTGSCLQGLMFVAVWALSTVGVSGPRP